MKPVLHLGITIGLISAALSVLLRRRRAGSFPEQRLVIEPSIVIASHKTSSQGDDSSDELVYLVCVAFIRADSCFLLPNGNQCAGSNIKLACDFKLSPNNYARALNDD